MGVNTQGNFAIWMSPILVYVQATPMLIRHRLFFCGHLTRGTVRAHMLAALKANNGTVKEERQLVGRNDRQRQRPALLLRQPVLPPLCRLPAHRCQPIIPALAARNSLAITVSFLFCMPCIVQLVCHQCPRCFPADVMLSVVKDTAIDTTTRGRVVHVCQHGTEAQY